MKERKIIGYNPFLDYEHLLDKSNEYIINYMKNYTYDTASGMLWLNYKGKICALLIVENAKKLYEYTLKFCDGSINDWFYYSFTEINDGVELSIFQNIKKSIERYNKIQYFEENVVLTTPISAFTKDKSNYLKFKDTDISVGILDILDCQFGNYDNFFIFATSKMTLK